MTYGIVLSALADPTRRGILESLRSEPKSVGQLSSTQPVSRPAVSQHLKVLYEAGLVEVSGDGTRRIYKVKRDGLVELQDYLNSYWSDVLTAFSDEIKRKHGN